MTVKRRLITRLRAALACMTCVACTAVLRCCTTEAISEEAHEPHRLREQADLPLDFKGPLCNVDGSNFAT